MCSSAERHGDHARGTINSDPLTGLDPRSRIGNSHHSGDALSAAPHDAMFGRALCMSLTANLTNVDGVETIAYGYLREQPIREAASEPRLTYGGRRRGIVNLVHVAPQISRAVISEMTARLGLRRPQLALVA